MLSKVKFMMKLNFVSNLCSACRQTITRMGVEEAVKEAPKAAMDIIALLRDLVFYLGLMTPACFEDLVRLLLPLLSNNPPSSFPLFHILPSFFSLLFLLFSPLPSPPSLFSLSGG